MAYEAVFFNQSINQSIMNMVFRRPNVLQGTPTEQLHHEWYNSPARSPLLYSVTLYCKKCMRSVTWVVFYISSSSAMSRVRCDLYYENKSGDLCFRHLVHRVFSCFLTSKYANPLQYITDWYLMTLLDNSGHIDVTYYIARGVTHIEVNL